MALSAMECGLLPISQHSMRFYNRISYHDYEGIALDLDERARLIADLGDNSAMILRNHGFLTAGRNVAEAFSQVFYLEKCAKSQIQAMSAVGLDGLVIPSPDVCEHTAQQFARNPNFSDLDWRVICVGLTNLTPVMRASCFGTSSGITIDARRQVA